MSFTPIYSDLNQKDPKKDLLIYDVNSVLQQITNVLSTHKGDRFFNPEFGTDDDSVLFEIMDDVTTFQMESRIIVPVERWIPIVSLDFGLTKVSPDPDQNRYTVQIVFKIPSLNDTLLSYNGYKTPN